MTVFTRAAARDFLAAVGRCAARRGRGPDPPVAVRVRAGTRTLAATTPGGVTLTHTAPAAGGRDDLVVLPAATLAAAAGGTDDPVVLDRAAGPRAVVRWADRGAARVAPADPVPPGPHHPVPDPPPLAAVGVGFLAALAACAGTAAREAGGRYALDRVQVRGRAGTVVGTDSKVALLWPGFTLPFPDDVLIPAVPVFGGRELARAAAVRVGRTATHLVVAAGPWAVWLPVAPAAAARYPDVAALVPRHHATTAGIDPADAADLLRLLPGLPGAGDADRPVTLDVDGGVTVRGRDAETGLVRGVTLSRSPAAGRPARVAVDRAVLARALALGCHTVRLTPDRAVVFAGDPWTLLAAPLAAALAVGPEAAAGRDANRDAPPDHQARPDARPADRARPPHPHSDRRTPVKPPDPHRPGSDPRPDPGHPPDGPDPLAAAEDLRAALADAAGKAARLVAALKAGRKEKRALASVWAGLKQLHLGGRPR